MDAPVAPVTAEAASTDVSLWPHELAYGALPPVCPRTGAPAVTRRAITMVSRPSWVIWVLAAAAVSAEVFGYYPDSPFGFGLLVALLLVVVGVVGAVATQRRVAAHIPLSQSTSQRHGWMLVGGMVASIVVGVGLWFVAAVLPGDPGPSGIVAVAGCWVILFGLPLSIALGRRMVVRSSVHRDPRAMLFVRWRGVHAAFAAALAERRSLAAARPQVPHPMPMPYGQPPAVAMPGYLLPTQWAPPAYGPPPGWGAPLPWAAPPPYGLPAQPYPPSAPPRGAPAPPPPLPPDAAPPAAPAGRASGVTGAAGDVPAAPVPLPSREPSTSDPGRPALGPIRLSPESDPPPPRPAP